MKTSERAILNERHTAAHSRFEAELRRIDHETKARLRRLGVPEGYRSVPLSEAKRRILENLGLRDAE